MKGLILLTALLSTQAFAGTIICNRMVDGSMNPEVKTTEDADQPEVVDFLRVEGLIDAEGFLTVRKGIPTMATFKSKRDNTNICQGVNVNEDGPNSGGSPTTGWWKSQLDSKAFKIRLFRDPVTKEIQATTFTDSNKLVFRNCEFIEEEGDQEELKALWEANHDPEMEEQMRKDSEEAQKRLADHFKMKAERFLGITPGGKGSSFTAEEAAAAGAK